MLYKKKKSKLVEESATTQNEPTEKNIEIPKSQTAPALNAGPIKPKLPNLQSKSPSTSISLKEMMNADGGKVEDKQEKYQNQTEDKFFSFTFDELILKWVLFAEKYKESQARLYSTLLEHQPILVDSNSLRMIINNPLQENAIGEIKSDILIFLRKELKNDGITLVTEIQEVIAIKSAFTPAEKFRLLSEMNPSLGQLRQVFDLDF